MTVVADRFTCPGGLHERGQKFVATKPCTACRASEALAADAELLHTLEPSLDRDAAAAIIESAAPARQQRSELHAWLRSEPDPLRSGASSAPKVAQRLLAELDRRGVRVARPRCLRCGGAKMLVAVVDGGRLCFNCYHYDRAESCARCGRTRPVCAREADGRAVCSRCRTADPDSWRPCGRCGTNAPTVAVTDGVRVGRCCYVPPVLRCSVCGQAKGHRPYRTRRPVCADCAARPRVACVDCGLDAPVPHDGGDPRCHHCQRGATDSCAGCAAPTVGRAADGSPRCPGCYDRPVRPCGRCGRPRVIVRLAIGGEPELCGLCWKGPVVTCEGCGQRRACRGERTGMMLCASCQRGERQACAFCGQTRRVVAHWPDGPVCPSCYPHHRSTRGDCSTCGQRQRLLRHTRGAPACAACLGVADSGVCASCGADDEPLWERGRCPRCTLAGRLPKLLGDDAARAANGLDDLHDALLAAPSARAVLDWLRRSDATDLLARIAGGELARTHEALDTLAQSGTIEHLRHLLVAIGALPPRDPALAALDRWIDEFLDGVTDADHVALLRPYARWRILRPVRAKAEAGPISDATGHGARTRLRAAATFLAFVADRGRAPGDCRQVDIDAWFTEHPDHRTHPARPFVTWAMERHAIPRLDYPPRGGTGGGTVTVTVTGDERWVVARHLLQDPGIDTADRVAGALVVIYAQPLARITRLSVDDVTIKPDRVSLRLGHSAIDVPHPLDDHLRQLIGHPPNPSTVRLPTARWLFPSRTAKGRPTSALTIGKRLGRLGVVAGQFRQAALFQLCAELPAAVVADLLGISITTAELWARLAGREQADYMQLRGNGLR